MTKDEALIFAKHYIEGYKTNNDSWGTKVAMVRLADTIAEQDSNIAQLQETIQVIEDGIEADKAMTEALKKVDANTIEQLQSDNVKLRDFIDKAFQAHTNLDLDVEAQGETK